MNKVTKLAIRKSRKKALVAIGRKIGHLRQKTRTAKGI